MTDLNRTETDAIGSMSLPKDALYGINTLRACENFPITDVPLSHFPSLVSAIAMVKHAAATTNTELESLTPEKGAAIAEVCHEIYSGQHHEHFRVDMIQGGAGTSTNMNANEVIANLALKKLGHCAGEYQYLHPNDHVNRSQSTNDVYPTSIRLAILMEIKSLCAAMTQLQTGLEHKADAFCNIQKIGRTQLQDAVPMSLGDEFASFAVTISEDIERLHQNGELLKEVNLGGTAIGTGCNAPKGYSEKAISCLSEISGFDLKPARHLIEASSDLGAFVSFSGVLKRIAVKLSKICNDLRLLSSGPRGGMGEISLPTVQAGSSIMPGKVNPVIPEMVNQVAYLVIGNDLTITMGAEAGQLQLNAMEPVIVFKVLESVRILGRAITVLQEKCISGIKANEDHCAALLSSSLVLAALLVPHVGYDRASAIAKEAQHSNRSILQVALEQNLMPEDTLTKILSPAKTGSELHI